MWLAIEVNGGPHDGQGTWTDAALILFLHTYLQNITPTRSLAFEYARLRLLQLHTTSDTTGIACKREVDLQYSPFYAAYPWGRDGWVRVACGLSDSTVQDLGTAHLPVFGPPVALTGACRAQSGVFAHFWNTRSIGIYCGRIFDTSLAVHAQQPAEVCAADTSRAASTSSYDDISKLIELDAEITQAVDDGGSRRVA